MSRGSPGAINKVRSRTCIVTESDCTRVNCADLADSMGEASGQSRLAGWRICGLEWKSARRFSAIRAILPVGADMARPAVNRTGDESDLRVSLGFSPCGWAIGSPLGEAVGVYRVLEACGAKRMSAYVRVWRDWRPSGREKKTRRTFSPAGLHSSNELVALDFPKAR